jgi:hypothetical protein
VLEKVVKVSATSATNGHKALEDNQDKAFPVADIDKSISHLSATRIEVSATDKVSATYPPLEEPLQAAGLNGLVADVADVADKIRDYSKAEIIDCENF